MSGNDERSSPRKGPKSSFGKGNKPSSGMSAARMAMMMSKFQTPVTGASPSTSPRHSRPAVGKEKKGSAGSAGGGEFFNSPEADSNPTKKAAASSYQPKRKKGELSPVRQLSGSSVLGSAGGRQLSGNSVLGGARLPASNSQQRQLPSGGVVSPAAGRAAGVSSGGLEGDDDDDLNSLQFEFPDKTSGELNTLLFSHGHDLEATWVTLDSQRRGGGVRSRSNSARRSSKGDSRSNSTTPNTAAEVARKKRGPSAGPSSAGAASAGPIGEAERPHGRRGTPSKNKNEDGPKKDAGVSSPAPPAAADKDDYNVDADYGEDDDDGLSLAELEVAAAKAQERAARAALGYFSDDDDDDDDEEGDEEGGVGEGDKSNAASTKSQNKNQNGSLSGWSLTRDDLDDGDGGVDGGGGGGGRGGSSGGNRPQELTGGSHGGREVAGGSGGEDHKERSLMGILRQNMGDNGRAAQSSRRRLGDEVGSDDEDGGGVEVEVERQVEVQKSRTALMDLLARHKEKPAADRPQDERDLRRGDTFVHGNPPFKPFVEPIHKIGKFLKRTQHEKGEAEASGVSSVPPTLSPASMAELAVLPTTAPTAPTFPPTPTPPGVEVPVESSVSPLQVQRALQLQQPARVTATTLPPQSSASTTVDDDDDKNKNNGAIDGNNGYGPTLELADSFLDDSLGSTWRAVDPDSELEPVSKPSSSDVMTKMKSELARLKVQLADTNLRGKGRHQLAVDDEHGNEAEGAGEKAGERVVEPIPSLPFSLPPPPPPPPLLSDRSSSSDDLRKPKLGPESPTPRQQQQQQQQQKQQLQSPPQPSPPAAEADAGAKSYHYFNPRAGVNPQPQPQMQPPLEVKRAEEDYVAVVAEEETMRAGARVPHFVPNQESEPPRAVVSPSNRVPTNESQSRVHQTTQSQRPSRSASRYALPVRPRPRIPTGPTLPYRNNEPTSHSYRMATQSTPRPSSTLPTASTYGGSGGGLGYNSYDPQPGGRFQPNSQGGGQAQPYSDRGQGPFLRAYGPPPAQQPNLSTQRRGLAIGLEHQEGPLPVAAVAFPPFCPDLIGSPTCGDGDDGGYGGYGCGGSAQGGGGVEVSIRGFNVGLVHVVACLLCDVPAVVVRQSRDEVVVEAQDYHAKGLRRVEVGSIELQNTREEVLVFPNAFAYVPAAYCLAHPHHRDQGDEENEEGNHVHSNSNALKTTSFLAAPPSSALLSPLVLDVETTFMASKSSATHSISMGLDELNFAVIRHWHKVRVKVDPANASLSFKLLLLDAEDEQGGGGGARSTFEKENDGDVGNGDGNGAAFHEVVSNLDLAFGTVPTNIPAAAAAASSFPTAATGGTATGAGGGAGGDAGGGLSGSIGTQQRAFSVVVEKERKHGRPHCVTLLRSETTGAGSGSGGGGGPVSSSAAGAGLMRAGLKGGGSGFSSSGAAAAAAGVALLVIHCHGGEREQLAVASALQLCIDGGRKVPVKELLPAGLGDPKQPVQARRSLSTANITQGKRQHHPGRRGRGRFNNKPPEFLGGGHRSRSPPSRYHPQYETRASTSKGQGATHGNGAYAPPGGYSERTFGLHYWQH